MEVAPCVQEEKSHPASLLGSLNLQRQRAQFCDCVVRQKQNPGQLHPAHKCVLAASSPVFASILSSTGALVELQAPCLSDSALALLLDYIYTGALPYTQSRQQYYSLLTAAYYLQMDELQEALKACKQSEVKAADDTNGAGTGAQPYGENSNTYSETVNTLSKDLPSSLKRKDHQYSASVDTCEGINLFQDSSRNGVNHCNRKDACTSSDASTCCSRSGSTETYRLSQKFACAAKVHRVDQRLKNDPFHSTGTEEDRRAAEVQEAEMSSVKRKLCLTVKTKAEEKETNREEEDKTQICHSPVLRLLTSQMMDISPSQCSSTSSSSSLHPCSGAVPVIRHSSGAAMLQPPSHPVSQASVSPSRDPDSRSGSTDSDTRRENHYEEKNPNNIDHIGTQSWDYKDSSNQSDSSLTYHLTRQKNEHMSNGLSHITEQNEGHGHCDPFQNKNPSKHFRDDSVHCRNYARRLKYKTDFSFDDFTSKHQCADSSDVLMEAAPEEQSIGLQDPRAGVPLPVQDSGTGSGSRCEDLRAEEEVKEEHSNLRCAVETDSHCDLHKAEASTKDAAYSQHEQDSRDTTRTDIRHSVDVFLAPNSCLDSNTGGLSDFESSTSVEFERSGTEITEPHLFDPTYSVVGPSYHGHLRYHCLPQEERYLSHSYGSNHSHPDHSDHSSEEEVGAFGSPGCIPLRQHFATGSTDQVLLLDISAKPAELLVANAFGMTKTSGFGSNGGERWNGPVSDTESQHEETNKEGKRVGKDHIRAKAELPHKAGVVESDSLATPLTVSSPPGVPESAQSSMSSTLSVCIPSTVSASLPTNLSAHLSNPVHHPFQCSLCDRSFSQRGSLNRHVRSHLGVRPFPCPRCPMTFSRQYRVTEHMRVHQRCILESGFQQPPEV